jgi:hypothetical protein
MARVRKIYSFQFVSDYKYLLEYLPTRLISSKDLNASVVLLMSKKKLSSKALLWLLSKTQALTVYIFAFFRTVTTVGCLERWREERVVEMWVRGDCLFVGSPKDRRWQGFPSAVHCRKKGAIVWAMDHVKPCTEILVLERVCLRWSSKHFGPKNLVKSLLISTLDKGNLLQRSIFTGLNKTYVYCTK